MRDISSKPIGLVIDHETNHGQNVVINLIEEPNYLPVSGKLIPLTGHGCWVVHALHGISNTTFTQEFVLGPEYSLLMTFAAAVKQRMMPSFFAAAPLIPNDAIFALTAAYNADTSPIKVNLGQGSYRDGAGKPWVLPSVSEARSRIAQQGLDHEYLPILGSSEFRQAVPKMVLGTQIHQSLQDKIASCQSLSGTGGLYTAASLLKTSSSLKPTVWIPEPTWSNHHLVFSSLGFECRSFPYFDHATKSVDFKSYLETLQTAEPGSIVILHACAHNPTGCDPSHEQWQMVGRTMKDRNLFPLFDAAYLGFNSGSIDRDAFAIRHFIGELGMEAAVAVSFAKNMGLYGERVGCSFFVLSDGIVARNVESVLERLQRATVSNPPAYGAKIATTILNDDRLRMLWSQDLVTMCSRINDMRQSLHDVLVGQGAPGAWSHIVQQSGMFSFLGLPRDKVLRLKDEFHIYMSENSRISMAGLNESNVAYVARAIAKVLQEEANDDSLVSARL